MPFGRPKKPLPTLDEAALYENALAALGRRMLTESELVRRLRTRVEPGEAGAATVAAVVARLREYGLLNDRAFADNYVQLRQQNEKLGARRVRQDLAMKGVARPLIEETVEARYAEVSEEQLARQHLDRKRVKKPANDKEAARVMRMLVRAGFSLGVTYKILRQWDVDEATLSGMEGMDEDAAAEGAEE